MSNSNWKTEFLLYLNNKRALLSALPEGSLLSLETHLSEIWRAMREGLEGLLPLDGDVKTHYLSRGLESEFRFADGRTYRVRIEVINEPEESLEESETGGVI